MKKLYTKTFLTAQLSLLLITSSFAQTYTSTFEDLALPADTFWDGSNQSGGFTSGIANFGNVYDPSFGGYWAFGWTYSSLIDTTTAGYTNPYSARTGTGYNSSTYAVGQQNAIISFPTNVVANELYITNSTYAALSMEQGDGFAKKFGGASGNDPDWFKLTIYGIDNGTRIDSTEIYLADFRFADNNQDYILDSWQLVTLGAGFMGDSLMFQLSSSDNGSFGMNTPGYFAIDDLKASSPLNVESKTPSKLIAFPNPATNILNLNINTPSTVRILNSFGQTVLKPVETLGNNTIDINQLVPGVYFIEVINSTEKSITRFVKE